MLGKISSYIYRGICIITIFILANFYSLNFIYKIDFILGIAVIGFIFINFIPSFYNKRFLTTRLRICGAGYELLILFSIATLLTTLYCFDGLFLGLNKKVNTISVNGWIINILIAIVVLAIIFWNGIVRVYLTSIQLGIKLRVIGIICGWIPIANIIALGVIMVTVRREVEFENDRIILNKARRHKKLCETKYPILLIHGVFFRDSKKFNYWGRIPKDLEENGAKIYYGNHQSADTIENSAKELITRIQEVLRITGADKVNIIAHSKGGLDSRYAIALLDGSKYVASITTINTPHRGCLFADYLLSKIPEKEQVSIASAYNRAAKKIGDFKPDFLGAVYELTSEACEERNKFIGDVKGVFYQSIGSKLNVAYGGEFPLNFTYLLVEWFDGNNDGLVGEHSFKWGEHYDFITVKGKRGVSHGDMVDSNRENIKEFNVREFYVDLVNGLKLKGF